MASLKECSKQQLVSMKAQLDKQYEDFKARGLKLDMSRGKPGAVQLNLSNGMMDVLKPDGDMRAQDGTDVRNYGLLDGIPEAKQMFADILEMSPDEIIVGGNSSLNMMYDTVQRAMQFGVYGSEKPWNQCGKIKFLCPAPGYDRHFAICELFGIEMITVPMLPDGPDMDMVEQYVNNDPAVKGIWCVPIYSNPDGITYSDQVVRRFANLEPKANDFRIFWDNAYVIHHLFEDHDTLLNLMAECKKIGKEDMVFTFASTSKITFPGAGIAALGASKNNVEYLKKLLAIQTICGDKINQLRHMRFFKDADGVRAHMKKHAEILAPKFQIVLDHLSRELAPLEAATWKEPKGGYFVSVYTLDGCAKRTVQLCKEAGVVLTGAGASYPYGKDPHDANIRLAPTFPPNEELELAMELFCLCVKLASVEKLLAE